MLARANRVTSATDYRRVVRSGTRVVGTALIAYRAAGSTEHFRFGFVVSRRVGGAVERNRVRRRLKAACAGLLPTLVGGRHDVVFRALPGAATASWSSLQREVARAVESRAVERKKR